ncbi:MAG: hypothetical protein ACYS21_07950, partial [Planctomycetota bacterium]
SDFNDVNLADVNKLHIGFGNRDNPVPGGKGIVYFDDIRLYIPRCVPALAPAADFASDCVVDLADFAVFAGQWRESPGSPSADIAPDPPDGFVDGQDLDVLMDSWLDEQLWPQ